MNRKSDAASAYKESTYENAPPIKVVRMMYAGALRFLGEAEAIDPKQNPGGFAQKVNRVDAIVSELRLALDHGPAPELSKNLTALYLFVESQLREAVLQQQTDHLAEARRVLETLGDAWKQVEVE